MVPFNPGKKNWLKIIIKLEGGTRRGSMMIFPLFKVVQLISDRYKTKIKYNNHIHNNNNNIYTSKYHQIKEQIQVVQLKPGC